jgi:hypothetical protein
MVQNRLYSCYFGPVPAQLLRLVLVDPADWDLENVGTSSPVLIRTTALLEPALKDSEPSVVERLESSLEIPETPSALEMMWQEMDDHHDDSNILSHLC